jgi:16S rRNA (uracil1498-N3)-methyltransferase
MREHKISRIYYDSNIKTGDEINLLEYHANYLFKVMRKRVGHNVALFNSNDGEFIAEIISIDKKSVSLKVNDQIKKPYLSPNFTLAFSPIKNPKPEFIVQKATELGVSKIIPVIFENTVKDKTKTEKLGKVAIESVEQCERFDLPEIFEAKSFNDFLQYINEDDQKLIFLCDETGQGKDVNSLKNEISDHKNKEKIIIIGPEGGFTKGEINQIYSLKNCYGLSLGPRILRAETAIISSLSVVQSLFGDFESKPDFRKDI